MKKAQVRLLLLLIFSIVPILSRSQTIVRDTLAPAFEWILPIIDYPFMIDAAQSEANRRVDGNSFEKGSVELGDFGKGYRNLSMNQNTEMARNLHGTFYYGHNVLWNKLLKPTTTKRYLKNRIFANITSLATDYLLTKLPYGYAYQHEEFHRSVMAVRGIYSYDEVWNFGKGFDIAVTRVKDEDLVNLKKDHPADLVRLSAAGVEGEYAYFQRIKEDNFFDAAGYPSVGLMILGTLHAVNYVNLPLTPRFNRITDSILSHDQNDILARDFTGYDFSAWVYDLHRPYEPYENRGEWPGGIGIRRPIKESDLTDEMKDFLRETGTMQYLNFISPFIVGINQLKLNDNVKFNFAFRSIPTSFGYYSGADLFLKIHERKMMLSLGANKSKNLTLPSIDLAFYDFQPKNNERLNVDLKLALWLQPKNQYFFATSAAGGFSAVLQPTFQITKNISIYSDLAYKSKGWQFGNPYLDSNFSARFGLKIRTSNFRV